MPVPDHTITLEELFDKYLDPAYVSELRELLHLYDTVRVYQDHGGNWRWRRTDQDNHEKIAVSGESFESMQSAVRAAERACPGCTIEIVED